MKAKMVLFFSKWTIPMVEWYLEVSYGKSLKELKDNCNSLVSRYRKDKNYAELYGRVTEDHIPLLSKFSTSYQYVEIQKKFTENDGDLTLFMPWIEDAITDSFRDLYNLFIMGCMSEWERYLFYSKPKPKIKNLVEDIVDYLKSVREASCNISEEDYMNVSMMRTDMQSRKELTTSNPLLLIYEKYMQLVEDGSLETLFYMLNSPIKPEEGDKRSMYDTIILSIRHLGLAEYLQKKYDLCKQYNQQLRDIRFADKSTKVPDSTLNENLQLDNDNKNNRCADNKTMTAKQRFFIRKYKQTEYKEKSNKQIEDKVESYSPKSIDRSELQNILIEKCKDWKEPKERYWKVMWCELFIFFARIGLINIYSDDDRVPYDPQIARARYKPYVDNVINLITKCQNNYADNFLGTYLETKYSIGDNDVLRMSVNFKKKPKFYDDIKKECSPKLEKVKDAVKEFLKKQ